MGPAVSFGVRVCRARCLCAPRLPSLEVGVKSQLAGASTLVAESSQWRDSRREVTPATAPPEPRLKAERAGDRSLGGGEGEGGVNEGPKSGMYTLVYLVKAQRSVFLGSLLCSMNTNTQMEKTRVAS